MIRKYERLRPLQIPRIIAAYHEAVDMALPSFRFMSRKLVRSAIKRRTKTTLILAKNLGL